MDVCTAVHQAFSEVPQVVLSAHDVDLDGESGPCGPSGPLLGLLDEPRKAGAAEGRSWALVGGEPVLVSLDGPGGSGRYWSVHLVQRAGHACLGGTTVAFRHLYAVTDALKAEGLAPLPALGDVDGDGAAELVIYSGATVEPEWGNSGVVLALPVLTLAQGRWTWDEAASRMLAGRLAKVYASLAAATDPEDRFGPAREVADALQRFAERRPCTRAE
jgi:hypothetical protein